MTLSSHLCMTLSSVDTVDRSLSDRAVSPGPLVGPSQIPRAQEEWTDWADGGGKAAFQPV